MDATEMVTLMNEVLDAAPTLTKPEVASRLSRIEASSWLIEPEFVGHLVRCASKSISQVHSRAQHIADWQANARADIAKIKAEIHRTSSQDA